MSTQFIPNGDSFIGNVTPGQTFTANIIANSPTAYLRILNGGDQTGNTNVGLWVAATTTTGVNIDSAGTSDPAWLTKINGSYLEQDSTTIVALNNTPGNKQDTNIIFSANIDVASTGTHAIVVVQPVLPL